MPFKYPKATPYSGGLQVDSPRPIKAVELKNSIEKSLIFSSERETYKLKYQLLKNTVKSKATRQGYKCTQVVLKIPAELNLELFKNSQISEEPVWEPQPGVPGFFFFLKIHAI